MGGYNRADEINKTPIKDHFRCCIILVDRSYFYTKPNTNSKMKMDELPPSFLLPLFSFRMPLKKHTFEFSLSPRDVCLLLLLLFRIYGHSVWMEFMAAWEMRIQRAGSNIQIRESPNPIIKKIKAAIACCREREGWWWFEYSPATFLHPVSSIDRYDMCVYTW